MRRARGFTLMEILVAMALTTIVTASVLAIVRTQLMTFEMNDQVVRMQQNERAAMDFVEMTIRRACSGVNQGAVGVNVSGVTPKIVPCFKIYDGATVGGTSISTGTLSLPDAIEVVFGTGTMTVLTGLAQDLTKTPTINVKDTSNFSVNDYVLVGDMNNANLYKVASKTALTLTFDAQATAATTPTQLVSSGTSPITGMVAGTYVFKAATYTFFVVPPTTNGSGNLTLYSNTLMVDPNGVASLNHLDYTSTTSTPPTVQPAVEGIIDFQAAIGEDTDQDGKINDTNPAATDEWLGNAASELSTWPASLDPNTNPWNQATLATMPQLRQVRIGLIVQTMNKYAGGSAANLPTFEDRTTLPSTSANGNPRYRPIRMVVAPRAWNLSE